MIQINYGHSKPIYEQVKDSLRQLMLAGLLKENEKLPSVRELAVQLAINPNTIQRAYRELEAEGCIVSEAVALWMLAGKSLKGLFLLRLRSFMPSA